jgi:hypothetical protein
MPDANLESLVAYLRLNSQRFSLDALRQQLATQGYDAALIDEAINVYRGEASHTTGRGLSGWKVILGCLGGLVIGGLSFVSLLIGICGPKGDGTNTSPGYLGLAAFLVLLALACALYPFFSRRRTK